MDCLDFVPVYISIIYEFHGINQNYGELYKIISIFFVWNGISENYDYSIAAEIGSTTAFTLSADTNRSLSYR